MSKKLCALFLLFSLSLHASDQAIPINPYTPEMNAAAKKNVLTTNLGCILAINEFLVGCNDTEDIVHAAVVEHNDILALKEALYGRKPLPAEVLIPQIAKIFNIREQIWIQNYRNETGKSLLSIVCSYFHIPYINTKIQIKYATQRMNFLRYLIANKVDVNSQDIDGNTAIHHATKNAVRCFNCAIKDNISYDNNYFINTMLQPIEILVTEGHANINIKNNKRYTPLLAARNVMIYEEHEFNRAIKAKLKLLGASDLTITREKFMQMSAEEKREAMKNSTP